MRIVYVLIIPNTTYASFLGTYFEFLHVLETEVFLHFLVYFINICKYLSIFVNVRYCVRYLLKDISTLGINIFPPSSNSDM